MDNENMVNIGTPERPVLVPSKALLPKSDEGREWWEAVASGSVILEDKTLDLLLKRTDEENK